MEYEQNLSFGSMTLAWSSPGCSGTIRKSLMSCRPAGRDRARSVGPSGFRWMWRRRKLSGRTLPRPGNSLSDSAYVLTRAYRRLGSDGAIRRRRTVGKFQMRFQYGAGLAMGRRGHGRRRRCLSNFKRLAADAMKIRRLYFFGTSRFLERRRWIRLR